MTPDQQPKQKQRFNILHVYVILAILATAVVGMYWISKQQPVQYTPQQHQPSNAVKQDSVVLTITANQETIFNAIDQHQLLINREREYLFLDVLKANHMKRSEVEGKRIVTKKED